MSAYLATEAGYLGVTRSTGTPREIEYQLFSQITGRLHRANDPEVQFSDLAEAVFDNLSLWRTIALDVADQDNDLPDMLRAQLFYLYEFTSVHTRKVLQREADATALIEINTSIMRGLKPKQPGKGPDQCLA